MPLYEYACPSCGYQVELMQSASSAAAPDTCNQCGAGPMQKMLSRTSFILKGGGWYKDGYSKDGTTKSASSDTSCASGACQAPSGSCSTESTSSSTTASSTTSSSSATA